MEAQRQDDRRYTYADTLTWDDDARCELIDGVPHIWEDGKTVISACENTDTVPVHVLEGCAVSLPDMWGSL